MDNQKFAAQEAEHIQLDMIGRDIVNRVEVCVCVCVCVCACVCACVCVCVLYMLIHVHVSPMGP